MFWSSAYTLRCTSDGSPAVPSFLLPLVDSLLSAGKSAVLLRASAVQAAVLQGKGNSSQKYGGSSRHVHKVRLQSQQLSWCSAASSASGTPRGMGIAQMARPLSPTKQRMTAINALGYNVATATPRYTGHQKVIAEGQFSRQLFDAGDELQAEQNLHASFIDGLQKLMQPVHATDRQGFFTKDSSSCISQVLDRTTSGARDGSAVCMSHAEDTMVQDAGEGMFEKLRTNSNAACTSQSLFLSPSDDLPPLTPVPRSILQLNAPQAVITEASSRVTLPGGSVTTAEILSNATGKAIPSPSLQQSSSTAAQHWGHSQVQQPLEQSNFGDAQQHELPIADRMQRAARQRVHQACSKQQSPLQMPLLPQQFHKESTQVR